MKRGKLLTVAMATALSFSTLAMGMSTTAAPASYDKINKSDNATSFYQGAPLDLGIVNSDRMIESLINRGVIAKGLSPAEQEAALNKYLQKRAKSTETGSEKNSFAYKQHKLLEEAQSQSGSTDTKTKSNGKGNGKKNQDTGSLDPVQTDGSWPGDTRKDNVLVLLIDYPDFPHSNIDPQYTDMYYEKYPKEHFQNMIFGENGYTGPNGENLISMKQYYEAQSGGSYTVDGNVAGWYTASKPAAYYGGNNSNDNDSNPRSLVYEALVSAANDPSVDLSNYDQEDRYDLDGDGNFREPDGLIDHLMVIHSGIGEEAGGGKLGPDAIWSHRWDLGGVATIPGTEAEVDYWGGSLGAFDYTIEPEDGATGVFAHEYGHDLGLPDEYDTIYSGGGEPVSYWSIMASGSWAGEIPGAEPTGFSPYAREFLQEHVSDNWQQGKTVSVDSLKPNGETFTLDQASSKGSNEDVVRIDLPDQTQVINTPAAGDYEYYGGKGDEIDHSMVTNLDLTGASSATLDFDTWYEIESNWDFAMVQVSTDGGSTWSSLETPNTTSDIVVDGYPAIQENVPGYTGSSGGWIHETIDLSGYAGQEIMLQFRYMTDWGSTMTGFFVDNISVVADGSDVLSDGAEEAASDFSFNGFERHEGKYTTSHYYLVEWRNHDGVDEGLAHIKRGNSIMSYDPGLVVWYVNEEAYDNNWVGVHPGKGFLGVVDSHQNVHHWGGNVAQGALASTSYQVYDTPFSLRKGSDLDVSYGKDYHLYNAAKQPVALFDDTNNYWNPSSPYSGLKLPSYGLKIQVLDEAPDRSTAKIKIYK